MTRNEMLEELHKIICVAQPTVITYDMGLQNDDELGEWIVKIH